MLPSVDPDLPTRLFVAVRPPSAVVKMLSALPRPATPGVRWVDPGDWHLTLRFLPRAIPAEVIAAVDQLDLPRTTVTLGPSLISFDDRVVVVPATGLDELATKILAATEDLGPVDQRPFRGHLTLARTNPEATCPVLDHPVSTSFTATTIELVATGAADNRPRYRTLETWRLRPLDT